jgi:hypothetical protein
LVPGARPAWYASKSKRNSSSAPPSVRRMSFTFRRFANVVKPLACESASTMRESSASVCGPLRLTSPITETRLLLTWLTMTLTSGAVM